MGGNNSEPTDAQASISSPEDLCSLIDSVDNLNNEETQKYMELVNKEQEHF